MALFLSPLLSDPKCTMTTQPPPVRQVHPRECLAQTSFSYLIFLTYITFSYLFAYRDSRRRWQCGHCTVRSSVFLLFLLLFGTPSSHNDAAAPRGQWCHCSVRPPRTCTCPAPLSSSLLTLSMTPRMRTRHNCDTVGTLDTALKNTLYRRCQRPPHLTLKSISEIQHPSQRNVLRDIFLGERCCCVWTSLVNLEHCSRYLDDTHCHIIQVSEPDLVSWSCV